jgi:small-conductance mechanosensitive channel
MEEIKEILIMLKDVLGAELFQLGGNKISILSLTSAMVILFVSYRLSKVAENLVSKHLSKIATDLKPGLVTTIEKFSGYAVLVVGFIMVLDTLGISLSSLAALSAVFMVGIGFGLQNIAQNFISGLILLLERPVTEGDLIKVDGVEGRIIDIRARATVVQTRDDVAIIVPNSKLISDNVVNDHHLGPDIRMSVSIGVAYGSDVELVKKLLIEVGRAHSKILKNPSPDVLFVDFGESSLDFKLQCWTDKQWEKDKIQSDLRFAIDKAFRENNISIPFPQRDVHMISR